MFAAAVVLGVAVGFVLPGAGPYGRPRAIGVIVGAAGTQVASQVLSGWMHTAGVAVSLVMAAMWLALQRRHLASVLLAVGASLNVAVIAANGGMPVDPAALDAVGRTGVDVTDGFLYKHVAMDGATRLGLLADRIPIPVQRNVISIGDVLMAFAILLWVASSVRDARAARNSTRAVNGEHGGSAFGEVVALR
jgi:hypothetical protein